MIRIITDAMSDLTREDAVARNVTLVPMPIRFGMEESLDSGNAQDRAEFFARMRVAAELPRTSMVPMAFWLDAFRKHLRNPEDEVLCITGSSKLSGGFHSAELAREECGAPERVALVDSLLATCGEMLLVEEAVRLRDAGAALSEIVTRLEDLKRRQITYGLAEDLKYLIMGGRLNPLIGKVGGALNIKPILTFRGGSIEKAGVIRGLKKGFVWYIEQLKKNPPDPRVPLYIGGADCEETVSLLEDMVLEAGIDARLRPMGIGCLIGAHVGPGLTLMSWVRQE